MKLFASIFIAQVILLTVIFMIMPGAKRDVLDFAETAIGWMR